LDLYTCQEMKWWARLSGNIFDRRFYDTDQNCKRLANRHGHIANLTITIPGWKGRIRKLARRISGHEGKSRDDRTRSQNGLDPDGRRQHWHSNGGQENFCSSHFTRKVWSGIEDGYWQSSWGRENPQVNKRIEISQIRVHTHYTT